MELSGSDLKELVIAIPGQGAACLSSVVATPGLRSSILLSKALILGFARWWPILTFARWWPQVCRTWALLLGFVLGLTRSAA